MPKLEKFYKNSDKRGMTIEEWVIAKALEDLALDLSLRHQRLVELKMELGHKLKKSLMKVSIIALKSWGRAPIAMRVLQSVSVIMPFK